MFERDPLADPEPVIRRVYAYVAYRIGDGVDAEDITSSTIERAERYRDRFYARRADATTWLIGIARRQISDRRVAQPVPVADLPEETTRGALEPESAIRIDLHRAVLALGERDGELVALRYGADLTVRQIGEVVGMQTNAVEVALHGALAALGELLEAGEESAPPDTWVQEEAGE